MKIDKGVPLPNRIAKRKTVGPLPLADMEKGDSIFIKCVDEDEATHVLKSLRVRLSRFSRDNPDFKFSSSKCKGGVRLWRV